MTMSVNTNTRHMPHTLIGHTLQVQSPELISIKGIRHAEKVKRMREAKHGCTQVQV